MSFIDHDDQDKMRARRESTFGGAVRYGAPPKPSEPKPTTDNLLGKAIGDLMKLRLNTELPPSFTAEVNRIMMSLMMHRQMLDERSKL